MRYRGLLLQAVLALSAVGALGAASYAFPPRERAGQDLPQGEEALLRFAQERMNRNAWQEADRAYKAFLERHPGSAQAEQVHMHLGQLHLWHSRRPAEAREWYEKACARWPKSPNYWGWRFQIAQTFAQQNLREKAVAAYRAIGKEAPDAGQRAQAVQQAWNLEGKYFYMSVHQTFTAGQSPEVNVQIRGIEKIDFRAVHIAYDALIPHLQGADGADLHGAIGKVPAQGRRELKAWTQTYTYDRNNDWKNESVKVPSTAPGVYLVEGEYDGVTMSVTLFVSRNGLTAKAAAGKLLCFVQDRATSKPAADVAIKVLHGEAKIEGRTDAQGVFVAEGFKGGAVIAMKDGDLATTQSHYSAANGERPLIHITTDRPIYRPNQKVFFRVVHRTEQGESLEVAPGRKTVVEIRDAKGNKVYERPHALDAFGATEGELVLGDEPPLGEYLIVTRNENESADLHQHSWRWLGRWGHGPHNVVRFRVDEYRKPEYKVDVTYAKPRVLQGEAVEAVIDARYYFGSPVADAEATWQVFRKPAYSVWRCWPFYYDWYAEDEEMHGRKGGYGGPGEMVLQGSGKTDRDGKVKVVFTAEKQDHDAVYTVVAKVTDASRRAVDGSSSCKAARAEFALAMTLDRSVYKPGDRVNAKVRAATPDDQPVAGTRVTLKAYDRRWQRDRYDDALLFQGAAVSD
ncbi:MAG TPA: MG2 domain-containing protein, partial [Planctomycetota bacterium]|nr:MG2 domain-containing protein [Planctomycetota bacterium]